MLDVKGILPSPFNWRELYLPELINGNATLPTSVKDGHGLTLTGARKGSTCLGVEFDGSATANVNAGALYNGAARLWISLRFQLQRAFGAGAAADQFIFGKYVDADNYLELWLENADGALHWSLRTGAVTRFNIATVAVAWNAGTWYHVIASISNIAGVRLRVDNGAAVTNADLNAAPAGGDFVIGDFDDPGAGTGTQGRIEDVIVGTDDLTAAEETELFRGFPPADAVNFWPLDEGRGVTATDRGSGANNGTLDTAARWKWDNPNVRLATLGFDGINDVAATAASVLANHNVTFVWVGRMKSTYTSLTGHHRLLYLPLATGSIALYYDFVLNDIRFVAYDGTLSNIVSYTTRPAIDSYHIFICMNHVAGTASLYVDGVLIGSNTGGAVLIPGAGTLYLGRDSGAQFYDISRPLLMGIINGAVGIADAQRLSRNIDAMLGLQLRI